jgi:hypothetical protein
MASECAPADSCADPSSQLGSDHQCALSNAFEALLAGQAMEGRALADLMIVILERLWRADQERLQMSSPSRNKRSKNTSLADPLSAAVDAKKAQLSNQPERDLRLRAPRLSSSGRHGGSQGGSRCPYR